MNGLNGSGGLPAAGEAIYAGGHRVRQSGNERRFAAFYDGTPPARRLGSVSTAIVTGALFGRNRSLALLAIIGKSREN